MQKIPEEFAFIHSVATIRISLKAPWDTDWIEAPHTEGFVIICGVQASPILDMDQEFTTSAMCIVCIA